MSGAVAQPSTAMPVTGDDGNGGDPSEAAPLPPPLSDVGVQPPLPAAAAAAAAPSSVKRASQPIFADEEEKKRMVAQD